MIQATTPTLTLTLPETVDLSTADNVYVTFSQQGKALTKELGTDVTLISAYVIGVYLSQTETLLFAPYRPVNVQVNWMVNGARIATEIGKINITPNLIPEVIEP